MPIRAAIIAGDGRPSRRFGDNHRNVVALTSTRGGDNNTGYLGGGLHGSGGIHPRPAASHCRAAVGPAREPPCVRHVAACRGAV